MKKFLKVLVKVLIFFFFFAIVGGLIDVPSEDPAVWRFWAELVPFALTAVDCAGFWLVEKRQMTIMGWKDFPRNLAIGAGVGLIWVLLPTALLCCLGVISLTGPAVVEKLWLWMVSMFLNTIMQELLVRGYMYRLISREYHVVPAILFTTALFTVFHGGAFEAGVLAVINVVTMSLAMSFALEYTGSLVTPILMHGIYNLIDGILLGTGTVVDYPHLFGAVYQGPDLLTGGSFEMSGSLIVTVVNLALMAVFFFLWRKKAKTAKAAETGTK